MWNATRLIAVNLFLGLALAACGGGGTSLPGDGGSVTNPGSPDGGSTGGNGNAGGGTGSGDGTGGNAGDTQKPSVVSTDPSDRSELVNTKATITVAFNTAIDPQSVDASKVHLIGPAGPVDLDVSVEDAKLLLTPKLALAGGVSYTATVDAGIRSLAGTSLAQDYSWQFHVAGGVTGLCAGFYSADFALIEGKDTRSRVSGLPKPVQGVPYADPRYGSCVTRASTASDLGVGWVRSDYSRRQAFNADNSRYLVLARYGRWIIHNTNDTRIVRELAISGGYVEPQWHPTNPDILYVLDEDRGYTIHAYNVKTDERSKVADLRNVKSIHGYPGMTSITQIWPSATYAWTRWEGSPSADARYWAFMVQTSSGGGLGMITYDMETNTVTGVYDYAADGRGVPQPDHISMSPSGDYVVPSWTSPKCASMSQLGTRNNPCGLMSFTRDFSSAVGLAMASPHSDIGIDANGRDVIVASDYDTGWVEMWDLATGKKTRLWEMYINGNSTAMHISAKNFAKPGWVLISTYMEKAPGWYANKVMAVEMKADPRILNIAHTYNNATSYWSEVHGTVNRDFTRILFNSNWGSGGEDMDVYMITLPYDAVPAQ